VDHDRTARGGVFNGIVDQVGEDLAQAILVRQDDHVRLGARELQALLFAHGERLELLDDVRGDIRQRHLTEGELKLTGVDSGTIQQIAIMRARRFVLSFTRVRSFSCLSVSGPESRSSRFSTKPLMDVRGVRNS
jgi:hypothetical protein